MTFRQGVWIAVLTVALTEIAGAAANVWLEPWMRSLTVEETTNGITAFFANAVQWLTFPVAEISALNVAIAVPLFFALRRVFKRPRKPRSSLTRERFRELVDLASKSDTHIIHRPDGQSSVLHSVPVDGMSTEERLLMRVLTLLDGGPLPVAYVRELFHTTIAANMALKSLIEKGMIDWNGSDARLGHAGTAWAHQQLQAGLGSENLITVIDRGTRISPGASQ